MSARQALILLVTKNQMLRLTTPNARTRQSPLGKTRRRGRLTTVGLRPPFVSQPRRHSHPDCRSLLTLIVAQQPFAPNWVNLLLKCTYPNLSAKTRSKYAAALRYVGLKKEPGQKVMDFVRENGGLNGCVEKEKKLRAKKQKMGKGLGRTRTRRP